MDVVLTSEGLRLDAHLARPPQSSTRLSQPAIVLCHGLPVGSGSAGAAGHTFWGLADRVAADAGWMCLTFNFRGTGSSEGEFSLRGWEADLDAAVAFLRARHLDNIWLAGFSTGGTLAIRAAGLDADIRGLASLAAPSDLSTWARDPNYLIDLARHAGLLAPETAPDPAEWAADVNALDPLGHAARIPPRPFLIMHGSADDTVPAVDARALADAAEGQAELHVIPMGGHELRHDPRAIAVLLGWLERQAN